MILAALIDAGVSAKTLLSELNKMNIEHFQLEVEEVNRLGIRAKHFSVKTDTEPVSRYYYGIVQMIRESGLSQKVKDLSLKIFETLALAESKIHSQPVEKVHFHEIGAIDSIIDIVGVAIALQKLKVSRVYSSPLPLGGGFAKTAHGVIPLPAPATLEILKDMPVLPSQIQSELVTPTGAAIIKCISDDFGSFPEMKLTAVGCGAGTENLEIPNLLRVLIGQSRLQSSDVDEAVILETNIDDMNPELLDYVEQRLFDAGAFDVWLTPIYMKKNRPAVTLSVMCESKRASEFAEIIFMETTTLGIRSHRVDRSKIPRKMDRIVLPEGNIRVKVGVSKEGSINLSPEYDDCAEVAKKSGKPIKEIYDAAKFVAAKRYSSLPTNDEGA